ncbi:cysteine proteinase [Auriscalpium vulgare]|uniref:Cysteine proteinase n=1 Tax=Auriscalpium vulgare TaxID=40419 RepID=A0ACB8R9A1_9AGAM|nr:cysteine proteinase [Auriscalpium vulgare]
MAISKAVKWMPFPRPQTTSPAAAAIPAPDKLPVLDVPLTFPDEKQFGLENFGNTCYANSVLQALYFCSPFRDLVIQSPDASAPLPAFLSEKQLLTPTASPVPPQRRKSRTVLETAPPTPPPPPAPPPALAIPPAPPTLFSALRSLFVFISKNPSDRGAVAPSAFIDKLRETNELFRGSMHQDAHEFLNYLLNKIVEEIQGDKNHRDVYLDGSGEDSTLSSVAPPTTHSAISDHGLTLVHRLFEGTLTSETRCLTCETVSSRDESFLDLSIDIEQNSSVTACLRQFSASEMLCQKNKFFCDSCCGLQEAEKRMKIKKLPNVLALHLKRFKYQEDAGKYVKLAYRVAFPFELRLFNTVDDAQDPDRLYELFAIVVHIGSGPSHGHYITIVKGPHGWLVFDDHKIDPIKESEIPKYYGDSASGSAYVLYYQAVDVDPTALGIKVDMLSTAAVAATALNGANLSSDALSGEPEPGPAVPPGLTSDTPSPTFVFATAHPATPSPPPSEPERAFASPVASSAPSSPVIRKASAPALRVRTVPSSPALPSQGPPSATTPTSNGFVPGSPQSQSMRVPQSPRKGRASADDRPPTSPGSSSATWRGPSTSRRPATSQGFVAQDTENEVPPVPPMPELPHVQVNGKEHKEAKDFERKPSFWSKRRSLKPDNKEGKEKKDKHGKEVGTSSAPSISSTPSHASEATTSGGSIWRRSSVRLATHTKRLSASYSNVNIADTLSGHPSPASAPLSPVPPTPGVPLRVDPAGAPAQRSESPSLHPSAALPTEPTSATSSHGVVLDDSKRGHVVRTEAAVEGAALSYISTT